MLQKSWIIQLNNKFDLNTTFCMYGLQSPKYSMLAHHGSYVCAANILTGTFDRLHTVHILQSYCTDTWTMLYHGSGVCLMKGSTQSNRNNCTTQQCLRTGGHSCHYLQYTHRHLQVQHKREVYRVCEYRSTIHSRADNRSHSTNRVQGCSSMCMYPTHSRVCRWFYIVLSHTPWLQYNVNTSSISWWQQIAAENWTSQLFDDWTYVAYVLCIAKLVTCL